jgi:trimethylamine---corrinoid protein Co-methyltransferase
MDAIREVGPGGHYLGCEHTQANFKSAFWRSDLFDYKPFETWAEEGARDTQALANRAGEEAAGRLPAARAGRGHPRGAG